MARETQWVVQRVEGGVVEEDADEGVEVVRIDMDMLTEDLILSFESALGAVANLARVPATSAAYAFARRIGAEYIAAARHRFDADEVRKLEQALD